MAISHFIRRVLLCWIVLTFMLLILWVKAHAQSPYLESHHKIVNRRLPPPSLVQIPFVARVKGHGIVITCYRTFTVKLVASLPDNLTGFTDEHHRILSILQGQAIADEQVSVAHEIKHAAVGTDRSSEDVSLHEAIYLFSNMEPELLHHNPDLVKYLTQ